MNSKKSTEKSDIKIDERFFSLMVTPINDIEEGKSKGHYNSINDRISSEFVPLKKAAGAKRIYFIPVTERVTKDKEATFLTKFGKKSVTHAPNYLLGAMAQLKEKDFPEELKLKDFVAVSTEKSGVFRGAFGTICFLCCSNRFGKRSLRMVRLADGWSPGYDSVLLAEDIKL